MKRIIEFLFFRWKWEVIKRGKATFIHNLHGVNMSNSEFEREYVDYKLTNKFDGSVKIKRKYLN